MANSYSTSDLLKGALQRSGEITDGTSSYHGLALKYLNNVYLSVLSGSNEFAPDVGDAWVWARQTTSFIIQPKITTSAAVTQNSRTITLSTAPASSLLNYWIKFTDSTRPTFYLITAHTAGTTAVTLNQIVIESTAASVALTAYPLIYDLAASVPAGSSIMRLVEPLRVYTNRGIGLGESGNSEGQIDGIDIDTFRSKYPLEWLRGNGPSKFATLSRSDSSWVIQVNRYCESSIKVDFDYIPIPDDLVDATDSIPVIPREYRKLLESGAAFYVLSDKNEKEKAAEQAALTKQVILSMWKAEQKNKKLTSSNFGKINPRQDDCVHLWGYYNGV